MPEYTIQIPKNPASLVVWMAWFGLLVFLAIRYRNREFKLDRGSLAWLALLSVLVLLLTPFLGVPVGSGFPEIPRDDRLLHLMFFAAVPWMVAGGILGLVPAMLLAGFSGILLAYLDTHHIFTPLLFMSAVLVFTVSIRQRFRTFSFRLLRFPLVAALASVLALAPLTFAALVLNASGDFSSRVLDAVIWFPVEFLAIGGMVMIGGVVSMFVRVFAGEGWGSQGALRAAPGETSLRFRFIVMVVPISLVLLIGLVAGSWTVAENAARRLLVQRMTSTAGMVADGLSPFIKTGNTLIRQMADDPKLSTSSPEAATDLLRSFTEGLPFFDQLTFVNLNGDPLASYPPITGTEPMPLPGEEAAIENVLNGLPSPPLPVPPKPDGQAVRMSFFATVADAEGRTIGVLWGWADLATNVYSRPYITALTDLAQDGGSAQIVSEDGLILFHSDSNRVMLNYGGSSFPTPTFIEDMDPSGHGQLEYYQPTGDLTWAVIVSMPARVIQVMAWQAVPPLLWIGSAIIVLTTLVALFMLGRIRGDVEAVTLAAEKVSRGELDLSLQDRHYVGEMNRLADTFQQMIGKLRSRMQKQSELLSVSERITGQLKLQDSLHVVLMAALAHGVSSVRIVLIDDSQQQKILSPDQQFGMGKHTHLLAPLDDDIVAITRVRGQWVMRESQIGKNFHLAKRMPAPGLLISIPLRWKNKLMGVFWVAYDDRTNINEDELAYFDDLTQKAAVAIINAKAFDESLATRKRLESVLTKLDDPVVIADKNGMVIYLNDAAGDLPCADKRQGLGEPIGSLFDDEDLLSLFAEAESQSQSKELQFGNGNTYHVTINPITIDEHQMGLACVFKDITHFRQQDTLKTEFVTTVSHELRSPLTLIHGYAKILRLTGNLNEQQDTYIGNIIDGVDEMKSLVQNLLDLGRLDAGDALEVEEIAVGEIVRKVMESMGAHAKQKNIEIDVSLPEEPIFIEVDITFLTQALKNLVDNAIKFTKSGGDVQVLVRKQENSIVFTIQDYGPGIAPLDQRKIFKRFFRSDTQVSQEQRSGSGLGLAIVKSIAERHGGKVWFESKLGKGSTFYLQIPALQQKTAGK